ncbi:hypothetical protein [Helicobacter ganmani]|uniref:hypothetical protein n=1 Tax=Helicobacter ganmani TaxID=60246 RepID=UPI003A8AFDB0
MLYRVSLKLFSLCLLCVLANPAFSKCYYIPCNSQISQNMQQAQNEISPRFDEVQTKLKELEKTYKNKLEELKQSNQLLKKQIALSKSLSLELKELLFLLKQRNQIESNIINQEAIKK